MSWVQRKGIKVRAGVWHVCRASRPALRRSVNPVHVTMEKRTPHSMRCEPEMSSVCRGRTGCRYTRPGLHLRRRNDGVPDGEAARPRSASAGRHRRCPKAHSLVPPRLKLASVIRVQLGASLRWLLPVRRARAWCGAGESVALRRFSHPSGSVDWLLWRQLRTVTPQ